MLYDYDGDMLEVYPTIVGDGTTDDTVALQTLVDTYNSVRLPSNLTIKISDTIEIDPAICKMFDGGNSTILISGDIPAFKIAGGMTSSMTASPSTLTPKIMNQEGGVTICNCKIQGSESGTGIILDGCFKPRIIGCYIHHVKTGIVIKNRCRDILILGNHIYACQQYGIMIDHTANVHQCNINNNIISYAFYCIYFNKCAYVANFQIVGNDIEISSYPDTQSKADYRCLMIDSSVGETQTSNPIAEIEIVGNTIQGHSTCDHIIEFSSEDNPVRYAENLSIVGNHISNCADDMIVLTGVYNVQISGNTMKNVAEYCVSMGAKTSLISVTDNIFETGGGLVETTDSCQKLVISNNIVNSSGSAQINLVGTSLANVTVIGNVISGSSTSVIVNPSSVTRVIVACNVCSSGTYTLHSSVTSANNV